MVVRRLRSGYRELDYHLFILTRIKAPATATVGWTSVVFATFAAFKFVFVQQLGPGLAVAVCRRNSDPERPPAGDDDPPGRPELVAVALADRGKDPDVAYRADSRSTSAASRLEQPSRLPKSGSPDKRC
jgi:hypothetical protein